jgi:hypothetical protein
LIASRITKQTQHRKLEENAMKARLFATIALVMFPTVAFAIDAGKTGGKTNETTPTTEANKIKPDDAKAAGTGGGKGAADSNSASNDRGSGNVGANGAAAAIVKEPAGNVGTPASTDTAGTGGGEGAKTEPEKTP